MARNRKHKYKVVEKRLGREGAWGFSYKGENLIELEKTLKGKRRFKVLIHEALHQVFPDATESQILKGEKIIGNILWDQNYRRVDNKNF
jgi:hypothetical protein